MSMKVADLHCDLFDALVQIEGRTIMSPECRCSLPQLRAGGVGLQVMVLFNETKTYAPARLEKQYKLLANLEQDYANDFVALRTATIFEKFVTDVANGNEERIGTVAALENASALCLDNEPWELCQQRFLKLQHAVGPLLYCTITWHEEIRFGGGNGTNVGLKDDGRRFIELLAQHGVAVDFSHMSDRMAEETLNFIDKQKITVRILASHSNFRPVCGHLRNLPDEISKEILGRGGIIGLNLMQPFIGDRSDNIIDHWRYAEKLAALPDQYVMAADFFAPEESDYAFLKESGKEDFFFKEFADASCYPRLRKLLQRHLPFDEKMEKKFFWENAVRFIRPLFAASVVS